MTIAVSSKHTMAGAQRVVVDDGFRLKPAHRRERLIALSRRWQAAQAAKQRTSVAITAVIERATRKHCRTRPYEPGNHGANPRMIIAMVAAWHGVDPNDITSRRRVQVIVTARHDAVAAVYLNCKIDGRSYSLHDLGRLFGIDHTTAYHALRKRGLK